MNKLKKIFSLVEVHEEDYKKKNNKNKNVNFVSLIKPELLENPRTNSILTNKSIDLTNYKENSKLNIF